MSAYNMLWICKNPERNGLEKTFMTVSLVEWCSVAKNFSSLRLRVSKSSFCKMYVYLFFFLILNEKGIHSFSPP